MRTALVRLWNWDAWANAEVLALLRTRPAGLERALPYWNHILGAAHLWLARIEGRGESAVVWPEHDIVASGTSFEELRSRWQTYVDGLDSAELERVVTYTNSKGEPWRSTIADILLHVVTHAGYHRGQIATVLRQAGTPPVYTDLIHAARNNLLGDHG